MARYSFTVGTETGSLRTLESDGESPEAARQSLQAKGYFVFAEAGARPWRQLAGRSRAGARINARTLLVFNQELLALVKAGLPILTALDLLRERGQHPRLRSLLDSVRDEVRAGTALSAAMGRHPRVFPPLYTAALHAGEQSGNFVDALGRYVEYQKRMLQLRQRLRAALTYPVLLSVASAGVVTFLLTYVVPVFSKIYGDMDSELPAATRILLLVTARFREWLPVVVLLAVAVAFLAWRWWRTPEGRRQVDRWLLQVPVIGPVLSGYLFSRFARTLAMLQAGGIPMIPSLETTLEVVGNAHLLCELRTIIPRVAAGSTLADALGRSGVVPALLIELIAVGETSGSLGDMLGHGADMYDAEMDTRLTALAAIIEPIIMVGMGLVVAAIVVVMYLPIFHLSAVMK
jgi:type IV pilus assembly protein PilC